MSEPKNGEESVSVPQAANAEGDGLLRADAPVPEDEAARLAAAQAERLRKREAGEVRAKPEESKTPAPPQKVSELRVCLYDNGKVELLGPINDPTQFFNLITQALFVLHNHTVEAVKRETEKVLMARPRVPFMQRVFSRGAKPGAPRS